MIEGIRGLAALVVVLQHLGIAQLGHAAVMVFFAISGYCIAAAAEAGRRAGMSVGQFLWRRLRRIYPPYFFAVLFYVLTRVAKAARGESHDLHRPWLDWVQTLTLTQWTSLPFHPVADPLHNPKLIVAAFWSLGYEDQFYLVMAAGLALALKRRVPLLLTVSGLTIVGLIWNCAVPGGWITGIFIEYWVHFALGALLFYVLCVLPERTYQALFLALVCGLGIYCATRLFPWDPRMPLNLRAYTELIVGCGFTLLLFVVRPVSAVVSRSWLWQPAAALGTISYSLYLINQFNLTLVAAAATRLAPYAGQPVHLSLMIVLHLAIASVFWLLCERPFLNRAPKTMLPESVRRAPTAPASDAPSVVQ
jgi:peptidoglycan/LPS O-acetylase OafA/YrhL